MLFIQSVVKEDTLNHHNDNASSLLNFSEMFLKQTLLNKKNVKKFTWNRINNFEDIYEILESDDNIFRSQSSIG